jgi:2'-5' RNA ligase
MEWPSYHLWIAASDVLWQRSSDAIALLARELGGPRFEPHVTLTSDLDGSEAELVSRTQKLASRLSAFELDFERIAFGDQHFRCIYAAARLTPQLAHARALARQVFGQPNALFEPHLSLAYGTFDAARKAAAAAALPAGLLGSFRVHTLSLIRSESQEPDSWHELCAAGMA